MHLSLCKNKIKTDARHSFMPQTCLIAAYDPWFIQLLRIYAEESGFEIIQAFEGQDVFPAIELNHPVVVLLQIDLPGQNKAREILNALQADERVQKIPIIVFSPQSTDGGEIEGANAHLQGTFTYEIFVDALISAGVTLPGIVRQSSASGVDGASKITALHHRKIRK
jgi:CheY-like chemotaxis protein